MSAHNIIAGSAAYTVLIRRGDQRYTERFWFEVAGGKRAALLAARKWRDEMLAKLPPAARSNVLRKRPLTSKGSSQPVGVSRFVDATGRLRFAVNWIDVSGKGRIKTFGAGIASEVSAADERRVERAAHTFRRAYELARRTGLEFVPVAGGLHRSRGQGDAGFTPPPRVSTAAALPIRRNASRHG